MIASLSPRRLATTASLASLTALAALGAQAPSASATACVTQQFNPKDPTAPLIRCCPPDSQCTQFPPEITLPPLRD